MKNALKLCFVIAATFGVIQLLPASGVAGAGKSNRTFHPVLARACMDCHSNETNWPWYSRIAPVSWMVARDVRRGRQAMDLSTWDDLARRNPRKVMGLLSASCVAIQNERMPPGAYRWMHPEAVVSDREAGEFCRWTLEETRRLKSAMKPRIVAQGIKTEERGSE